MSTFFLYSMPELVIPDAKPLFDGTLTISDSLGDRLRKDGILMLIRARLHSGSSNRTEVELWKFDGIGPDAVVLRHGTIDDLEEVVDSFIPSLSLIKRLIVAYPR